MSAGAVKSPILKCGNGGENLHREAEEVKGRPLLLGCLGRASLQPFDCLLRIFRFGAVGQDL